MSEIPTSGHKSGDDGKYMVVARRYRPLQFDQLVGQENATRALMNAIETGRVGHAYLFTGARGVGKTSTARIFAKALNAPEGPTATPDNSSDICQAIDAGEDVDVLEIDGASNRGIDEIRQLRAGVGMRPSRSRYKIYIIDEVHMLTQQAFNALLKTLEEPPEHVKFIFCTTDPEKIPITVLSRCQRFDFAPVETDAILNRLEEIVRAEGCQADQEALRLLARRAGGSMRDSQSLLEQLLSFSTDRITVDQVHSMLGTADDARLAAMATGIIDRDPAAVLRMLDEAVMSGIDAGQFAEQLLGYFRDLMAATVGCGVEMLRHAAPSSYEALAEQGRQLGMQTILTIVGIIDSAISRMRHSVHSRVLLEAALVQLCCLADLQAISDLAAGLSKTPQSGGTRKAAPRLVDEKKKTERLESNPIQGEPSTVKSTATQEISRDIPPKPSVPEPVADRQQSSTQTEPISTATVTTVKSVDESFSSSQSSSPSALVVDKVRETNGSVSPNDVILRWDAGHVQSVWRRAIESLDDMTANYAKNADRVEPAGDGLIRVYFSDDRQLDKASCEKPERRSKLEAALTASANRRVQYECVLAASRTFQRPARRALTTAERARRLREVENEPIIRRTLDLFDAEVVRVIPPPEDSSS
ncbi:MAG: DNA polymerase III subunit gamma/tau [Pirellulaceae bacterium]